MAWSRSTYQLVHQELRDGTATLVLAGDLDEPGIAAQPERDPIGDL